MAELSTLGSVIKTAYEGQSNTNAFTDADETKLDSITLGAEIGDALQIVDVGGSVAGLPAIDGSQLTGLPGGGTVDTSGTPVANDIARFTDADTIEGRSYSELKADLAIAVTDITDAGDLAALDTVGTAQIDALAVTDAQLAADSVIESKILDDAVTEGKIFAGSVTEAKLADNAVTGAKIADSAIELTHLADGTVDVLLGFDEAGDPSEITAGSGITISAGVITSSGGAVPTPSVVAVTALTSGGHILDDDERDHLNVLLLTASSSSDFVVIIPDNAAAADRWRVRSRTSGTIYIHRVASTLSYDNLASGPFTVGELITDGTSGATAIIVADTGSVLSLVVVIGTFGNNNQITGGTSSATADVDGTITDSTGTVNGADYVTVVGTGRIGFIEVESNAGTSPVITVEGETAETTVADANHDMNGFELQGALIGASSALSDDLDANGNSIDNLGALSIVAAITLGTGGSISDSGPITTSGALTKATHGGRVVVTSGNVTIPNAAGDVGMGGVIVLGGSHTITFNSTVTGTLAAGDLFSYYVQSTTVLVRSLRAVADIPVMS